MKIYCPYEIFICMKNLKIIMPPISLQKKFSETILSLEKLKEPQKLSKIQTQNLFELFMKKIFLGELIC